MHCGIVGPPLAGKSSLFTSLTGLPIQPAGSGRKETRRGVAKLVDSRLDQIAAIWKPKKVTYATVEYVDIPGFTSRVDSKEPYPPAYLSELRAVDMLALVIRDFENDQAPHPAGKIDAVRDLEDALLEFVVNDLGVAERRLIRLQKINDPAYKIETELLERCMSALSTGTHLRDMEFTESERNILRAFSFLSIKPLLIVLNVGEEIARNPWDHLEELKKQQDSLGKRVEWIPAAAGIEAEIAQLSEDERLPFLQDLGFRLPTLDRLITATYSLLGLITFFTGGDKECRARSVPAGSDAVKAAGKVHQDMARGFIRAEVFSWKEFVEAGSEARLKETGKMRVEGRNYIVQDGDVINVRFNV